MAGRDDAEVLHQELVAAGLPRALASSAQLLLAALIEELDEGEHVIVRAIRKDDALRIEIEQDGRHVRGGWPLQVVADLTSRWGVRLDRRAVLWLELEA